MLRGTPGNDVLAGGLGADDISGGASQDVITGQAGSDTLDGGSGDDSVAGNTAAAPGADADTIGGGPGSDTLVGGNIADVFLAQDAAADTLTCYGGTDTGAVDRVDTIAADCELVPAKLSIAGATTTEGDDAAITVTLDKALVTPASVTVSPSSGTAQLGVDAPADSLVLTIPAGQTHATGVLKTTEDDVDEPAETFTAALSGPSPAPAVGTPSSATVTIDDDDPTTVSVTLSPGLPDGAAGYYRTNPLLRVAGGTADGETRCVLDPPAAAASFDELPSAACAYTGAGATVATDGSHTVCAAHRTTFGTTSDVTCTSFKIDATAPVVTCATPEPLTTGDTGKLITATTSDATSGVAAATTSAPADTATPGPKSVVLSAVDAAGNVGKATCAYSVAAPPPVVLCGKAITLLDVVGEGRRVRVAGVTLPRYVGKTVTILAGTKPVGTAVVGVDNTWSAQVALPKKSLRPVIRYQAVVEGAHSLALKLERRLQIVKRSGSTITGRINAPKRSLPKRITLYRQLTCESRRLFAKVKLSRKGTFKVKLRRATPPEPFALYRIVAPLKHARTYTLPIAIR